MQFHSARYVVHCSTGVDGRSGQKMNPASHDLKAIVWSWSNSMLCKAVWHSDSSVQQWISPECVY